MSRPTRLLYPGALYHVTSRGNRLGQIFADDADRRAWLAIVHAMCARFHVIVHAYCLMTNHYHLLLETVQGNLPDAMRYLNGVYTQSVNRRHGLVGHLFQGRYKAIVVQKDAYLLQLARYIVLNPVRAGLVRSPDQWDWSSYHWTAGEAAPPEWLSTDWLLSQFGEVRREASIRYRSFVLQGIGAGSPLRATRYQLILGDSLFAAEHRQRAPRRAMAQAPRAQRQHATMTLEEYRARYPQRDEAMAMAFASMAFSMSDIARSFGVSLKTVSRAVGRMEQHKHADDLTFAGNLPFSNG